MTPIPPKVKQEILADDYYNKCCFHFLGGCSGRVTWEHSLIYGGKQVQEKEAIIPLCAKHHAVDEFQGVPMDKGRSRWVALNRMKDKFHLYPKSDWQQKLNYYNSIYGEYNIKW